MTEHVLLHIIRKNYWKYVHTS